MAHMFVSFSLVLQELQSIWDSCPDNVKYTPAIWDQAMDPHDLWFILRFYLDYLYSVFLIVRFKARQDQSQETLQLLASTARDVLSTVLALNEHRELMREVRSDFSAVVSVCSTHKYWSGNLADKRVFGLTFWHLVPAIRPSMR